MSLHLLGERHGLGDAALADALRAHGVNARLSLLGRAQSLRPGETVLARGTGVGEAPGLVALLRGLEQRGVRVLNPAAAVEAACHPPILARALGGLGVPLATAAQPVDGRVLVCDARVVATGPAATPEAEALAVWAATAIGAMLVAVDIAGDAVKALDPFPSLTQGWDSPADQVRDRVAASLAARLGRRARAAIA
jgi:hypothetical protein